MSSLKADFGFTFRGSYKVDGEEIAEGKLSYDGSFNPESLMEAIVEHAPRIASLFHEYVNTLDWLFEDWRYPFVEPTASEYNEALREFEAKCANDNEGAFTMPFGENTETPIRS